MTDADRMEWLVKHVTYLEHTGADGTPSMKLGKGEGGYWPQSEEDLSMGQVEDLCGLGLREFIDALMVGRK